MHIYGLKKTCNTTFLIALTINKGAYDILRQKNECVKAFEKLKIHLSCLIQPSQVKNYASTWFYFHLQ